MVTLPHQPHSPARAPAASLLGGRRLQKNAGRRGVCGAQARAQRLVSGRANCREAWACASSCSPRSSHGAPAASCGHELSSVSPCHVGSGALATCFNSAPPGPAPAPILCPQVPPPLAGFHTALVRAPLIWLLNCHTLGSTRAPPCEPNSHASEEGHALPPASLVLPSPAPLPSFPSTLA